MSKNKKIIFHIDLNSFFATCAAIKEPFLKDKVFVVGGKINSMKSVISAASYNARKYGIKSGMSLKQAVMIYPKLLIVPTDFKLYQNYSNIFFRYLRKYTKLMIKGSIDEAYMDMTELVGNYNPMQLAYKIQRELYKKYNLPVSIGISHTLFLAKMASDIKKPLGITYIEEDKIDEILYNLDVKEIYGLGVKSYPLLHEIGIYTIRDFINPNNKDIILTVLTENRYNDLIIDLKGKSNDIINPEKYLLPKNISKETTLDYLSTDYEAIKKIFNELFNNIFEIIKTNNYLVKTVSVKIRDSSFKTIIRSHTFIDYTSNYDLLKKTLFELLEDNIENKIIRLFGCGFSNIIEKKNYIRKLTIFD